ncbi:MAG: hypothetical protein ACW99G_10020, partial [Candidatus Thorarchaeota archaeon]|jgi:hypothetical protein
LSGELSSLTKYIFLLTFIAQIIFGVWFFFSPESWISITGWPNEPSAGRVLGAAIMVLALGGLLAFRSTSWEKVELFVIMQLLWNILGLVAMLWNYVTMTLPVAALLIMGIFAVYLVFYIYVYYQAKQ